MTFESGVIIFVGLLFLIKFTPVDRLQLLSYPLAPQAAARRSKRMELA